MYQFIPKALKNFPSDSLTNPTIERTFSTQGLARVAIDISIIGQMLLAFDAKDEVRVLMDGEPEFLPDYCERKGDTLRIEGDNSPSVLRNFHDEKIVIEVHLPSDCDVEVTFSAGVLVINGGTGALDVEGKMGEIVGVTHSDDVHIKLHMGEITLNGMQGHGDVQLSMGSVNLGWELMTGKEKIDASCLMGSLNLHVPHATQPRESHGGMLIKKRVRTSEGADIRGAVKLGSLEIIQFVQEADLLSVV